ncbi:hypothetical protein Ahy_A10g049804 [Arachis hypogaea]|uniref:PB1-like domain-containing protein n=1 Tax=Arachis hypogaea TaxID=3818 RepID=A0A445B7Z7_ARAHY|nr:hypothetical protein Ahy_A10g049804 [Arachis hypogaea]
MSKAVLGEKKAGEFGLLEGRDLNSRVLEKTMGYFKLKVYYEGWSTYQNGPLQYVGGETTVIEDIECDRWSIFEFGYVEENISALWFKDPIYEDMEKNLKLFKADANSIAMCKIAELRDYVELFVVHKVRRTMYFLLLAILILVRIMGWLIKVRDKSWLCMVENRGKNQFEPGADDTGVETRDSDDDDDNHEAVFGNSGDKYKPYEEEDASTDDLHFTDSEDELDPDVNGFEDVNVMTDRRRAVKKKGVAIENFENDEGSDSDELDLDHKVRVKGSDSDHERMRYPVHKAQKDMKQYKEEFNDNVTTYAVQTARVITLRKCDLKRVRTVCSGECPFWLYAAKIGYEDTWQFRSMNLNHTCRVRILHSKWLGMAFKKKVESNLKVKIKELVSKAKKKGTFREQYKRIYDYGHELLRENPDSSIQFVAGIRRCYTRVTFEANDAEVC